MVLIRWNPWNVDKLLDEGIDLPTIPGISRLGGQGLNLYETEDEIIAETALPGIPEKNIDVTVEDNTVRVFGSKEEKTEDGRRKYMTTLSSSYNYAFRLPEGVATNKEPVSELNDGVLTMKFPKVEKTPPKRLKITKKAKSKA